MKKRWGEIGNYFTPFVFGDPMRISAMVCMVLLVTVGATQGRELVYPEFKNGAVFRIEVSPIVSANEANQAVPPNSFVYALGKTADSAKGIEFWQMEVHASEDPSESCAVLRFSSNFSIDAIDINTVISGKACRIQKEYSPGTPSITEYGMVPYDYPVFPLIDGEVKHFTRYFKVTEDLKGIQQIEQRTTLKNNAFQVECYSDQDLLFYQIWKPGLPFPVYGENKHMKYELVSEE